MLFVGTEKVEVLRQLKTATKPVPDMPKDRYSYTENLDHDAQRIDDPTLHPNVRLYHRGHYDPRYVLGEFILGKNKLTPDLIPDMTFYTQLTLVSSRARAVIEAFDTLDYQYFETAILDKNGDTVNDCPVYWMVHRRMLEIDPVGSGEFPVRSMDDAGGNRRIWKYDLKNRTMHIPGLAPKQPIFDHQFGGPRDESYWAVSAIYDRRDIRACVESFPFWVFKGTGSPGLFMNQAFYEACLSAGLKGMREFSVPSGKPLEQVFHI